MPVTKVKKAEILKQLDSKFAKAKAIYFSENSGLTVKKMVQLRKKLSASKVDYVVAKKTLFNIAAKNNGYPEIPAELLSGPVAIAFGYDDVVTPVKILNDFAKDNEKLQILGGLVEGKYISKADAKALANLPSRNELLAKLLGSMQAPLAGMHGVMSGVLRKFVYSLNAIKDKKGSTAA